MATIICDISAWQYWRTPPMLRDVEIDPRRAILPCDQGGLGWPNALLKSASNSREAWRLIHGRLLMDLKGIRLPVHVMGDTASGNMRASRLIQPHVMPRCLSLERHTVHLGNDLYVLTPEATMLLQGNRLSKIALAKMMFSACGLFSLLPRTQRLLAVQDELVASGSISTTESNQLGLYGYSDEQGNPLGHIDPATGRRIPWAPAFKRNGSITDLWKHHPLTSVERIQAVVPELRGCRGVPLATQALSLVRNGAASPAEVYAYLLLCSPAWDGGESWEAPELNRRIALTPEAQALSHTAFSIGDLLWADRKGVLEVQGEGFHSDAFGFKLESGRRSALESMGYEAPELLWEQMANLELFDALLPSLAKRLGFSLRRRTPAFLKRRDGLHAELFGKPYETDGWGKPCL